jgi:hypothetical protein
MKKKFFKYLGNKKCYTQWVLVFLFFSSHFIFAQETHELNIILKLNIIEGDLKNSMVTITKKGAPYKVIDPNTEKLNVDLPIGFEYLITYTKIGYITQSVLVDTHVPAGREEKEFGKKMSEVELEKQPDGGLIVYRKPVARLAYSMKKEDFSYDKDFASKADKTQKKEKESPIPKTKETVPVAVHSNPGTSVVKQSESKSEQSIQKPIVKNKDVKVVQEDNKKITTITIYIDDKSYVYRKEEYNFDVFYYKDGKSITSDTYENETK